MLIQYIIINLLPRSRMYKIKTSNKMKLGKLKVRFSDVLLSDTEMKNVIGGANGPSDVTCNPQASESSCNGVCYSGTKQGNCGMEYISVTGSYMCACVITY